MPLAQSLVEWSCGSDLDPCHLSASLPQLACTSPGVKMTLTERHLETLWTDQLTSPRLTPVSASLIKKAREQQPDGAHFLGPTPSVQELSSAHTYNPFIKLLSKLTLPLSQISFIELTRQRTWKPLLWSGSDGHWFCVTALLSETCTLETRKLPLYSRTTLCWISKASDYFSANNKALLTQSNTWTQQPGFSPHLSLTTPLFRTDLAEGIFFSLSVKVITKLWGYSLINGKKKKSQD